MPLPKRESIPTKINKKCSNMQDILNFPQLGKLAINHTTAH